MVKSKKHPWYKPKGYLHFDYALDQHNAEKWVTNPQHIVRHRFTPLIHYVMKSRKVRRNQAAEAQYEASGRVGPKPRLSVKVKDRNIFYVSHVDGYIYSYYAQLLQKKYDQHIEAAGLSENVIAYRSIEKKGKRFCNIHFAQEAFESVQLLQNCHVTCFDLSKFFDTLSPEVLKNNWENILGVQRLPDDHYAVYKSIVGFRYVEETDLIAAFKDERFKRTPRHHGLATGSRENRICDYRELRGLNHKYSMAFMQRKENLKITGIAQGTSLSGLLSNIFMLGFDIAMKQYIESIGGFYRRYSDDIFIAVPPSITFSSIEEKLVGFLKMHCTTSIELNRTKTERKIFSTANGKGQILDFDKQTQSRLQYLGLTFDGKKVHLRNSTVSKDRAKIVQLIRKQKKGKMVGGELSIDTRQVYKKRSSRMVTPTNSINQKGFVNYASKAAAIHGALSDITQQVKKTDGFIKRAVKRERDRSKTVGE